MNCFIFANTISSFMSLSSSFWLWIKFLPLRKSLNLWLLCFLSSGFIPKKPPLSHSSPFLFLWAGGFLLIIKEHLSFKLSSLTEEKTSKLATYEPVVVTWLEAGGKTNVFDSFVDDWITNLSNISTYLYHSLHELFDSFKQVNQKCIKWLKTDF